MWWEVRGSKLADHALLQEQEAVRPNGQSRCWTECSLPVPSAAASPVAISKQSGDEFVSTETELNSTSSGGSVLEHHCCFSFVHQFFMFAQLLPLVLDAVQLERYLLFILTSSCNA